MTVQIEHQIAAVLMAAEGRRDIIRRARSREIKRSDLDLEMYQRRVDELEAAARTLQWVSDHAKKLRAIK